METSQTAPKMEISSIESPPAYEPPKPKTKSPKSRTKFDKKTIAKLTESSVALIFLTIFLGWDIALIVIGFRHKQECPVQDKIPLWMIVDGFALVFFYILRLISFLLKKLRKKTKENISCDRVLLTGISILTCLFQFIWFIIGNVWVYSIYNSVKYDKTSYPGDYCHQTCYLFAFWTITVKWILTGAVCLCCCCCCLCSFLVILCKK